MGKERTKYRSKAKRKRRENRSLDQLDHASIDPFYILATSPATDEHRRVLKYGDTFTVCDLYGDIKPSGLGEEGLYHGGTRFLSSLLLRVGGVRPLFLSSTVKEDNDLLAIDLTNPDITTEAGVFIPRGTLYISRIKFLWNGVCYEQLRFRNFGQVILETTFSIYFESDFADIFEVRGMKRQQRGQYGDPMQNGGRNDGDARITYRGLDGITRRTRIHCSPHADEIRGQRDAFFHLTLQPKAEAVYSIAFACDVGDDHAVLQEHQEAQTAAWNELKNARADACDIRTSNERFNDWLRRSESDLYMMTSATPYGLYPYAGVPWYSTPFGRDGIITALECLWLWPDIARGVLAYLAATQAQEVISEQDAEPGKILHETRGGEMAALREIPFGAYYGSVDSTPLFIMLAHAYYERTGDRGFIELIWRNIELALEWIDSYGDTDKDGFIEYIRKTPNGLIQQGWKDSHDSVFHADGSAAEPPIALCEVQCYVYAAKHAASTLAQMLGLNDRADKLKRQAVQLQKQFEAAFWCDDISTYALALDREKRQCKVRTSNAGHALMTGIASPQRAGQLVKTLLSEDSFSGWGVRTVSSHEQRYNPMSYHNGSIWPHDNALIAFGMGKYGLKKSVLKIFSGLFDVSDIVDLHRLPELFCGFPRRPGEGPTLYPVACSPQSWAAASVYLLLQSCLGLSIDAANQQLRFTHPTLPESVREVRIHNLKIRGSSIDLIIQRYGNDVGINVLRREGNIEVIMVK